MMASRVLVVIPARGGSQGIAKKNLQQVGGRSLVEIAVDNSRRALDDREDCLVTVSTDHPPIREQAERAGAWCPYLRDPALARDETPSLPVVQDALARAEQEFAHVYDIVVLLQATAPRLRPTDLTRCIEALEEPTNASLASAVLIAPVSTHPFKMKRLLEDGQLINYIDQGFEDMRPRQALPKVYRRAGSVYASWRTVIADQNTLVGEPCLGLEVPADTAIDIDTQTDLELVRLLCEREEST